jgi:hypothetical protein
MGAMKSLTLGKEPSVYEPVNLAPLVEAKPEMRRSFSIDGLAGEVCVSELSGFDEIRLTVRNDKKRADITLNYEGFAELARLLYVVNLNRPQTRPF